MTWLAARSTLAKFFVCLMVRFTGQRGTQKTGNGLGLTVPAASGTLGGSSPTANPVGVNIRGKGEVSHLNFEQGVIERPGLIHPQKATVRQ